MHYDSTEFFRFFSKHSRSNGINSVCVGFVGFRGVHFCVGCRVDDQLRTNVADHSANAVWIKQI